MTTEEIKTAITKYLIENGADRLAAVLHDSIVERSENFSDASFICRSIGLDLVKYGDDKELYELSKVQK